MSLATTVPNTSWAHHAHAFVKEVSGPEVALAADAIIFAEDNAANASNGVYDLGYIAEDGFSVETEDGDTLDLRDINGELLDSLSKAASLTLNITLLKPSEATRGKFWDVDDTTTGHIRVKELLTTKHYAVGFGNIGEGAIGSEAVIAPYVSVTGAHPVYAADTGWTVELTLRVLKGGASSAGSRFLVDFVKLTRALLGLSTSGSGQ